VGLWPNPRHGLLILQVSRSHTKTATQSVWLLGWPARRRDLYLTTLNTYNRQTPPLGFEPTISTGKRPQIYALDRAATGTGNGTYSDTGSDSLIISWNLSECNMVKILLFRKYLMQILFGWPGALNAGFPRSLQVDFRAHKYVTNFFFRIRKYTQVFFISRFYITFCSWSKVMKQSNQLLLDWRPACTYGFGTGWKNKKPVWNCNILVFHGSEQPHRSLPRYDTVLQSNRWLPTFRRCMQRTFFINSLN
jgi:hypothetical protein